MPKSLTRFFGQLYFPSIIKRNYLLRKTVIL